MSARAKALGTSIEAIITGQRFDERGRLVLVGHLKGFRPKPKQLTYTAYWRVWQRLWKVAAMYRCQLAKPHLGSQLDRARKRRALRELDEALLVARRWSPKL